MSSRTHTARPVSRRERFREALATATGQARLTLAYDWFRSEVVSLEKIDRDRAEAMRRRIADAMLADAEQLAAEAIDRAKAGRHGLSRKQIQRLGQRVRGVE
jgi:hypothetical protein